MEIRCPASTAPCRRDQIDRSIMMTREIREKNVELRLLKLNGTQHIYLEGAKLTIW